MNLLCKESRACLHILNETKNSDIRRLGTEFFAVIENGGEENINIDNFEFAAKYLSSSSVNLVCIAFNMFNGYTYFPNNYKNSLNSLCAGLDQDNCRIVAEAVAIYLLG